MSIATAAKERPILFSGAMVRAILDNRKSMTRRIVKPQPLGENDRCFGWFGEGVPPAADCAPKGLWCESSRGLFVVADCPYEVGMRLWVRETWAHSPTGFDYRADCELPPCGHEKWRPSIHMPRAASRLTLELTGVRVERIQSISAKDIIAEGAVARAHQSEQFGKMPVSAFDGGAYVDLISLWASGWEKINGKGAWKRNDFVWVLSFQRV